MQGARHVRPGASATLLLFRNHAALGFQPHAPLSALRPDPVGPALPQKHASQLAQEIHGAALATERSAPGDPPWLTRPLCASRRRAAGLEVNSGSTRSSGQPSSSTSARRQASSSLGAVTWRREH